MQSRALRAGCLLGVLLLVPVLALGQTNGVVRSFPSPGYNPVGITTDGVSLYVADESERSFSRTIVKIDPLTGADQPWVGGQSWIDAQGIPSDVVYDGEGHFYVPQIGPLVNVMGIDGSLLRQFPIPFRGGAVAYDPGTKHLYVGDFDGSSILVLTDNGDGTTTAVTGIWPWVRPSGMWFDNDAANGGAEKGLWVLDEYEPVLRKLDLDGNIVRSCKWGRTGGSMTMLDGLFYVAQPLAGTRDPGTIFVVDPAALNCNPNQLPVVLVPDTLEYQADPQTGWATFTLPGDATDPDGDYPLTMSWFYWYQGLPYFPEGPTPTITLPEGSHWVAFQAIDSAGGVTTKWVIITVTKASADAEPPVISGVSVTPPVLWPPNGRRVPVLVSVNATDNSGTVTCELQSIASNQGISAEWAIASPLSATLTASRLGKGGDRTYTLTVACSDAAGNTATAAATVVVPHDQRKK